MCFFVTSQHTSSSSTPFFTSHAPTSCQIQIKNITITNRTVNLKRKEYYFPGFQYMNNLISCTYMCEWLWLIWMRWKNVDDTEKRRGENNDASETSAPSKSAFSFLFFILPKFRSQHCTQKKVPHFPFSFAFSINSHIPFTPPLLIPKLTFPP